MLPPPPAASRPSSAGPASGAALSPGDLVGGRLPDATLDTDPVLLCCRCGVRCNALAVHARVQRPAGGISSRGGAGDPRAPPRGGTPARQVRRSRRSPCADRTAGRGLLAPGSTASLSGSGLLENVVVSGVLLEMYAKARMLDDAVGVLGPGSFHEGEGCGLEHGQ
ncbi:putative pentatricopeptide [Panicum miliaceum]|uniref:Pentatricopeptide n=1 Tax=Panicum miliaceum TaxID=4540 RepID=A0A3L6PLJ1_PANMI|nr:putative pentatricopeptide [Panicum miliaceum]